MPIHYCYFVVGTSSGMGPNLDSTELKGFLFLQLQLFMFVEKWSDFFHQKILTTNITLSGYVQSSAKATKKVEVFPSPKKKILIYSISTSFCTKYAEHCESYKLY